MSRRQNLQNVAWFWDLYNRDLLNLNPPYQRRSVWSQNYKDFFIDTVLLNYPAPAVFVYEEIHESGLTKYSIVDGKQRLTTLFEFIQDTFPISEHATNTELRGMLFSELEPLTKNKIWGYSFSVEYLPTAEEGIINNIFDRINRNVAKLSSQELRHAKFSGDFITVSEDLTQWMLEHLPSNFPQIASKSQKQMKDVELVAQILLQIEEEPKGYNSDELDEEFSFRDDLWENAEDVERLFREIISRISEIINLDDDQSIQRSRFKNQADFYTLIGVLRRMSIEQNQISNINILHKLEEFNIIISDEDLRLAPENESINNYYGYARAASNTTRARRERERILRGFILS